MWRILTNKNFSVSYVFSLAHHRVLSFLIFGCWVLNEIKTTKRMYEYKS